ncbi:hypothetical protein BASA81_010756 [Batrachochytrium salamandrivorans]|nr:hypothetical protein BASA81_010756 [Batrachochytrium salamandrivorans]
MSSSSPTVSQQSLTSPSSKALASSSGTLLVSSSPLAKHQQKAKTALQQPRMNFENTNDMEQYLRAHPGVLPHPEDIQHLVEEEFPNNASAPTWTNCDDSVLKQDVNHPNQLPFQIGDWIERLGDDMEWHLEPIRRIVVFQDTPNIAWYKTEAEVLVRSDRARCSQQGIQRQFGMRPYLWQQYTLLKLEEQLRFQPHHEYDFETFQCLVFAESMWEEWLHNERNADFLLLMQSKPQHVQDKLKHHLLSPFSFMDHVMQDWDFASAKSSVYLYNSLLGSGFVMSIILMIVQLLVPVLLLVYQVRSSPRFPAFSSEPNVSSLDFETIFSTDWDGFCYEPVGIDGVLMQYVVFFVYWTRVVPAVVFSFYDTVGDSPTIQSRINSLRSLTWNQGNDTVAMKCGFKLERYMNSVYIAAINLIMLICIFLSDNTVSIILNALAIEFVYDFDREVAALFWFDDGLRYLRAGVLEMAIRGSLLLEHLHSPSSFCRQYQVDLNEYSMAVGANHKGKPYAMFSPEQSKLDRRNPRYQDAKEKLWAVSANIAKRLGRRDAYWQFREQIANFGMVDTFFYRTLPKRFRNLFATGVFNRYDNYFTWSRWDQVLFLPPLPHTTMVMETKQMINFDAKSIATPLSRFLRWCVGALLFSELWRIVRVVVRRGQYFLVPFVVLDGVFEWFTFLFILIIFPIGLFAYMILIFECETVMTNTAESWLYNGDVVFVG